MIRLPPRRRLVVDASVAVKWFLPEDHSGVALRLLAGGYSLSAPDLLFAEAGNVLWKRHRRGDLRPDEAAQILADLQRLPLTIHSSRPLLDQAWAIAHDHGRSFYDSLYVALAMKQTVSLVTADHKLYNALRSVPAGAALLWVEELV